MEDKEIIIAPGDERLEAIEKALLMWWVPDGRWVKVRVVINKKGSTITLHFLQGTQSALLVWNVVPSLYNLYKEETNAATLERISFQGHSKSSVRSTNMSGKDDIADPVDVGLIAIDGIDYDIEIHITSMAIYSIEIRDTHKVTAISIENAWIQLGVLITNNKRGIKLSIRNTIVSKTLWVLWTEVNKLEISSVKNQKISNETFVENNKQDGLSIEETYIWNIYIQRGKINDFSIKGLKIDGKISISGAYFSVDTLEISESKINEITIDSNLENTEFSIQKLHFLNVHIIKFVLNNIDYLWEFVFLSRKSDVARMRIDDVEDGRFRTIDIKNPWEIKSIKLQNVNREALQEKVFGKFDISWDSDFIKKNSPKIGSIEFFGTKLDELWIISDLDDPVMIEKMGFSKMRFAKTDSSRYFLKNLNIGSFSLSYLTNLADICKLQDLNIHKFDVDDVDFGKAIFNGVSFKEDLGYTPILEEPSIYMRWFIFLDTRFNSCDWKDFVFSSVGKDAQGKSYELSNKEMRDSYRQMKAVMDKNQNLHEGHQFFQKEMECFQKIEEAPSKKLIYQLNSWISDFGNSWSQVLMWILCLWLLYCLLKFSYLSYWSHEIIDFHIVLSWTTIYTGWSELLWTLFGFLNPLAAFDKDHWNNLMKNHGPLVYLAALLFKITLAVLYYQLVISIKRLTKRFSD